VSLGPGPRSCKLTFVTVGLDQATPLGTQAARIVPVDSARGSAVRLPRIQSLGKTGEPEVEPPMESRSWRRPVAGRLSPSAAIEVMAAAGLRRSARPNGPRSLIAELIISSISGP
jgi:hypothetical protein